MASAQYLAEHLAEVPAMSIPTIIGRHDGKGRPGLFDSIVQAAWKLCLALRGQGPGTLVTAALEDEAQVKEILASWPHDRDRAVAGGLDEGHQFHRAPRHPARAITYFDRFGTTSEHGPGETLRFEDGPGAIAGSTSTPLPVVSALVADVNVPTGLRGVHRRPVAERRTPGRRGVHWARPARGGRRVGPAMHRRRLRRNRHVRLAHL